MLNPNDHVLDHVDAYLHEVLAPDDADYVERHAERCRICKVGLDEARKRQAAFETVAACEASEDLIQATLRRIDAHERSWRRFKRYVAPGAFAAVAACVLVLAGFHVYYLNLKP